MTDAADTDEVLINTYEGEVTTARESAHGYYGTAASRHSRFRVKVPGERVEREVSLSVSANATLTFNRGDTVVLIYDKHADGSDKDLVAIHNMTVDLGIMFMTDTRPTSFWLMVVTGFLAFIFANHWAWYIPAAVFAFDLFTGDLPVRTAASEYIAQQRIDSGLCEAPSGET